jgi:hypothetical protein
MPNVVQIEAKLRNLSDEQLGGELQQPSGMAPSYLVLTELQRRKDMRKSYEGEQARYAATQPTVAEEMAAGAGGGMPMLPNRGAGLGAVAGRPQRAFQTGGIVEGDQPFGTQAYRARYEDLLKAIGGEPGYQDELRTALEDMATRTDERRGDAWGTALLRAGLGIAGSRSRNTLSAIAEGGIAGLDAYRSEMDAVRAAELRRLGLQAQLGSAAQAQELARMQAASSQASAEQRAGVRAAELALAEERARTGAEDADLDRAIRERAVRVQEEQLERPPAAIQAFEYFTSLPAEEQKQYLTFVNAQRGRGAALNLKDMNTAAAARRRIKKDILKEMEESFDEQVVALRTSENPEDRLAYQKLVEQRVSEAFVDAYPHYADLEELFGRATAQRLEETGKPGGLKIIDAPPEGAMVVPLSPLPQEEAPATESSEPVPVPGQGFPRRLTGPPVPGLTQEWTGPPGNPSWLAQPYNPR